MTEEMRPQQQQQQQQVSAVEEIFEEQLAELEASEDVDVRALELPLARIKKIMKIDDEVECQLGGRRCMVSSEAPVLFAKACEIFVLELTERAWTVTQENKRRTLQRSDVCAAVARSDMYDFLIDIVPRNDDVVTTSPPPPPPPVPPPPVAAADPRTQENKRAWQQRIAEHLFYSHPLAHRLSGSQKTLKRPRPDDGLILDDEDEDEEDDDEDAGVVVEASHLSYHQPLHDGGKRRHSADLSPVPPGPLVAPPDKSVVFAAPRN